MARDVKHVWLLNHYAQEPGRPGGTRHFALAKHLPAFGWSTTIVAASVEHGTGRQRLAGRDHARLDVIEGVPFLWLRTSGYSGNGADRALNMLQYAWRCLAPGSVRSLRKPDVVVGSSVHLLAAWAGVRLARRHRVPFVFEVRDLWPETLIDMGRLRRSSPLAWALRRLEKHLYEEAERIVVLLPRAADYIVPLGIAPEKIVWIPNGVDLDAFPVTPLAERGANPFTLMYFGAHGAANGLDNVLHAMRLVEDRSAGAIRLRLIGDGPAKAALEALAASLRLESVSFEPPVPKSRIPALAAEASAFVFNLIDAPVFKYGVSSNKLFDFMAAGRPVIYCCNSKSNPLPAEPWGLLVPPGKPRQLAEAILKLAATPQVERARMGEVARRHVETEYGFERLAQRFAETLDGTLSRHETKRATASR